MGLLCAQQQAPLLTQHALTQPHCCCCCCCCPCRPNITIACLNFAVVVLWSQSSPSLARVWADDVGGMLACGVSAAVAVGLVSTCLLPTLATEEVGSRARGGGGAPIGGWVAEPGCGSPLLRLAVDQLCVVLAQLAPSLTRRGATCAVCCCCVAHRLSS